MTNQLSVSVAMTTYNGEKYILEQIESVLPQLGVNDELIIADDGSTDKTIDIIREIASVDGRIKIIQGSKLGIVKNFERVIKECNNQLIFLSDQDDVWLPNKVAVIREHFQAEEDLTLVMSDLIVVDESLATINQSYLNLRGCSTGIIKNIIRNGYVGCALAYRKELNSIILPFPSKIPMHDSWIGILAEKFGKVKLIEDKLVLYRRYSGNVTSMYSDSDFWQKLVWRLRLCYNLTLRIYELRKYKSKIKIDKQSA